ncbi:MAG TPA: hypothetical protein V6D11_29820 [Waterburya sp.]
MKREYLNYLKWTELLALMLELVEDEAQAVRVVQLALEVDLRLGARLAGGVKPEWQEQTVPLVVELDIPELLKIQLLGVTRSDFGIPYEETIIMRSHCEHSNATRLLCLYTGYAYFDENVNTENEEIAIAFFRLTAILLILNPDRSTFRRLEELPSSEGFLLPALQ